VADLVSKFAGRSIAVIGDVMLDQFMIGRVDRISPEAPVPVVKFEREDFRLGGAANVANNIAALGGRAMLVGLVGADDSAAQLRTALDRAKVDHSGLVADRGRPTTRKVRVVTVRNQQVARIDHERDADAAGAAEAALIKRVKTVAAKAQAVVL
jgi:D-beta-D-heptose 7-phosphate kinase/D-beta-D-heptose 1-phosphate adenosyltransferase